MDQKVLEIYTDGACSGNPGPGGWAAILLWGKTRKEISGGEENTTNNRMELRATIEAMKQIKKDVLVKIYTDSQYVQKGITEYMKKWEVNGWNKGKVKNIDLWKELNELNKQYNIEWHWVRGHSDNDLNNQADKLARLAIKKLKTGEIDE